MDLTEREEAIVELLRRDPLVGSDALDDGLLAATQAAGVHVEHVRRTAAATGTYTAILDADGGLVIAVADMTATDEMGPDVIDRARELLTAARHLQHQRVEHVWVRLGRRGSHAVRPDLTARLVEETAARGETR